MRCCLGLGKGSLIAVGVCLVVAVRAASQITDRDTICHAIQH